MKNLIIKQHNHIADIPAKDWDACNVSANPFISHGFLSSLEDSGSTRPETGWLPQHLSFRHPDGQIEAVVPAYVKTHSYGEYVFDHAWADAFTRAGGSYYPKLQIAVPFSPVSGPRLLRHPQSKLSIGDIGSVIQNVTTKLDMSSAHITFCEKDEWEGLGQAGWLQRLGIQFHWQNNNYKTFDDFLGALTSSHRKSIRRERRDANAAGLIFKTLRGADIKAQHWDAFYQFYLSTIDRKWGAAYLTREFFNLLAQRLADKIILIMAFQEDTPVAGALNLLGNDTLYGRNWGCIGQWPFLHFELCYYRALDFAIENGLKRVEAGAQGEHKVQRGYLPQLTYSAHTITHQGLANAVSRFLEDERKAILADMKSYAEYSPFRQSE
jgi:predicted N-acyltransferase